MEKNKQTKELLADSFHDLMLKREFGKITIRQITDAAGVIRPTFYYHFQDKYDLLEYILCRDVIDQIRAYQQQGLMREALRHGFQTIEKDREFYRRAFQVTGQNSFEDMLYNHIRNLLYEGLKEVPLSEELNGFLNPQTISMYYAIGLANSVKLWVTEHYEDATSEQLLEAYEFLLTHPIYDLLQAGREASMAKKTEAEE